MTVGAVQNYVTPKGGREGGGYCEVSGHGKGGGCSHVFHNSFTFFPVS